MPADDATSPDMDAITAAIPVASTSAQLQERLDREQRQAAITRQREYAETMASIAATADVIAQLLDERSWRTDPAGTRTRAPSGDATYRPWSPVDDS